MNQLVLAAVVAVCVAVVVAGFVVLAAAVDLPFGYFSKEPAETLDVPRYIGWQAHISVLIMTAGAAVALFAGLLVRRLGGGPRDASAFLFSAAGLTTLLVLDDFLQFHESVYPALFGLSERSIYPIYSLILFVIFWRWGHHVARDDLGLALLAGVSLALSVALDQFFRITFIEEQIIEDGAKMLGFALWTMFLLRTGMRLITAASLPTASERQPERQPLGRSVAEHEY